MAARVREDGAEADPVPLRRGITAAALPQGRQPAAAAPPGRPVNAVSLAFAIPVAVLDVAAVTWPLQVRYAGGDEDYLTFGGETEHPAAGEVIFADQAGRAHARRWTNRQSGLSAVQDTTTAVLIVAEALHDSAAQDVPELMTAVAAELAATWSVPSPAAVLTSAAPRFTFGV